MTEKREACGTVRGYMQHQRKHETTCIECKAAWRVYYAERRKHVADGTKGS